MHPRVEGSRFLGSQLNRDLRRRQERIVNQTSDARSA